MKLPRLWKDWGNRTSRSSRRAPRPQTSLRLEHLEDRLAPAADLLPDLSTLASESAGYLNNWYKDTTTEPGHTLLRLSNAVANGGAGALELRGGAVNADGTQQVYQRIYDSAGGYRDRLAGTFVYHPEHHHIHFEDFSQYSLRAVTANNGVGAILAGGEKTSFALLDSVVSNSSLPGFSPKGVYNSAGQVQGISVGWADVYGANLEGQSLDITNVAAGTYWLESVADPLNHITESNETNNTTRILITIPATGQPDYAGNTLATARNIGTLGDSRTFRDFVEPLDTNDYYRFSLSTGGNFSLNMDNLSANADVQLLDGSGVLLASSTTSGTTPGSISRTLAVGTYYVRVFSVGGASTAYALTMAAGQFPADAAGNTAGTARDLAGLSGTQTFTDYVAPADPNDYYRFIAMEGTAFTLRMDGLTGDADVQLLDENGVAITSSTLGGTSPEGLTSNLSLGHVYYVRVYPYLGASTKYTLTLTLTPVPPDGAGNSLTTARDIGALSATRTFQDYVGAGDANDFYRFTLSGSTNFSLQLNGLSADADVQLLNSGGTVLASSTLGGSSAEAISQTLAAGTYYVHVFPYLAATTNYALALTGTPVPADSAGNSLTTARDIGALSGTRTFQDYVGAGDANDFYRFTLSGSTNFSLQLNGLSADADVQLLNSGGTVLASSTLGGSSAEAIAQTLAAGTYYVRVFPNFAATTNYTLSLTGTPVPADGAGNSMTTARDIGALSGTRTFQDYVGVGDANDYYRFTLATAGNFSLQLTGLLGDADVQLLDSAGTVLASSTLGGTLSESISRSLAAGTYYVRVYPYLSASTNYSLTLREE